MTVLDDRSVDLLLREASSSATWPTTPDLRTLVLARIEREALRPGAVAPAGSTTQATARVPVSGIARGRTAVRIGRALAIALVALLLIVGIAVALGYRLPGLDIRFVDRLPPAGLGLDLGSSIALTDAVALDRPRVLVPAALPTPDTAFTLGAGDGRIITLAYRATAAQTTLAGSDLVLTVMAVPGDTQEALIEKLVGPGTTLDAVSVGGSRGWWIAGASHDILILRADGTVGVLSSALTGDTLVFSRDGTLYRLESALGRDATIAIAESMR